MVQIVFRNPFYLWTLVVVPIIIIVHFLSMKYSKKRAVKFANFIALARVSEQVGLTSNFSVLLLRVLVIIGIIFAIAGTTLWYSGNSIDADYVIAIDSSSSMLTDDFSPNRLEAAKTAALNFVNGIPFYSSAAIVSFAGTPFVNQPLTSDKILLRNVIQDEVETLSVGGTDFANVLITGTNLLMNSPKSRVIILLTDGRSNIGITVQRAIDYANAQNIIVNTIGLGTEEGYFIELGEQLGPFGINEDELKLIANSTGGTYYHPETAEELTQIYSQVANQEKTKVSLDLTFFLLFLILLLLVLEWTLINTRFKIIP